jgi:hypothetical protein
VIATTLSLIPDMMFSFSYSAIWQNRSLFKLRLSHRTSKTWKLMELA